jgi:hypothetical protein
LIGRGKISSFLVFGSLLCFAIQAAAARNNVFAVLIFGCAPGSRSAFPIATGGLGFQLSISILSPELPAVLPVERAARVSSPVATDFLSLGVHCRFPLMKQIFSWTGSTWVF